jgi:hypothetical protein
LVSFISAMMRCLQFHGIDELGADRTNVVCR